MRGLLVLVAACSADPPFCVESDVHVTQGIYGLVTCGGDAGESSNPFSDQRMVLQANGVAIAAARTDANGVFALEAGAGTYSLCYDAYTPCFDVAVPAEAPVRVDLHTCIGFNDFTVIAAPRCAP